VMRPVLLTPCLLSRALQRAEPRQPEGWRYSADYRTRTLVRSIFSRSVYFGLH
jgi:hypothetical protein